MASLYRVRLARKAVVVQNYVRGVFLVRLREVKKKKAVNKCRAFLMLKMRISEVGGRQSVLRKIVERGLLLVALRQAFLKTVLLLKNTLQNFRKFLSFKESARNSLLFQFNKTLCRLSQADQKLDSVHQLGVDRLREHLADRQ